MSARVRLTADQRQNAMIAATAAAIAALTVVSPKLGVLAAVLIVLVALVAAVRDVRLILHALVLSMFVESVSVGGVRVGRALAAVAVVAVLIRMVRGGRRLPRLRERMWVPALLYFSWALASGLWASALRPWASSVGELGLAACYFIAFGLLLDDRRQLRRLLWTYLAGAVVAGVYGVWQARTGARAVGLQGDPNLYALYQVAAVPVAVTLARTSRHRRRVLLLVPVLVLSAVAAQSRGGLLALALILLAVTARGDLGGVVARHRAALLVIAVAAMGLVAVVAMHAAPRLNPQQVSADRGSGRFDIWFTAWHTYLNHPLLGIGAGNFEAHSSQLLQTEPGVELDVHSVIITTGIRIHNAYLEALTELGPVGLTMWLWLLGASFATFGWRLHRGQDGAVVDALAFMLICFAAATVFLSVSNNKLLWMLVGLAASAPVNPAPAPGRRVMTVPVRGVLVLEGG